MNQPPVGVDRSSGYQVLHLPMMLHKSNGNGVCDLGAAPLDLEVAANMLVCMIVTLVACLGRTPEPVIAAIEERLSGFRRLFPFVLSSPLRCAWCGHEAVSCTCAAHRDCPRRSPVMCL